MSNKLENALRLFRNNKRKVVIITSNGFQIHSTIVDYDSDCIFCESGEIVLLSNVSTIKPSR